MAITNRALLQNLLEKGLPILDERKPGFDQEFLNNLAEVEKKDVNTCQIMITAGLLAEYRDVSMALGCLNHERLTEAANQLLRERIAKLYS